MAKVEKEMFFWKSYETMNFLLSFIFSLSPKVYFYTANSYIVKIKCLEAVYHCHWIEYSGTSSYHDCLDPPRIYPWSRWRQDAERISSSQAVLCSRRYRVFRISSRHSRIAPVLLLILFSPWIRKLRRLIKTIKSYNET